jgi:hypothetical protein
LSSIIKANALGHRSLLARGSWHTRGATQTTIRDAAQLLSQARQEAAALLAAAEVESRALRETARSDGYREGLQAGREQGHKQGVEEGLAAGWESGLAQVRKALEVARDVVSAAEETKSQAFVAMQAEIVELAVAAIIQTHLRAAALAQRDSFQEGRYVLGRSQQHRTRGWCASVRPAEPRRTSRFSRSRYCRMRPVGISRIRQRPALVAPSLLGLDEFDTRAAVEPRWPCLGRRVDS